MCGSLKIISDNTKYFFVSANANTMMSHQLALDLQHVRPQRPGWKYVLRKKFKTKILANNLPKPPEQT